MSTGDQSRLDAETVRQLYAEHAADLQAFLIGVLRNQDLATEAHQATFAKVVEAGHTAHAETMRGWLFRVAYHEAMAIRRNQQRDKVLTKKGAQANQSCQLGDQDPSSLLIRREQIEQMRAHIDSLPEEQLQVVRLKIFDQKTFAEIAAELNAPLGTVLTRMRLAMKKLKDRMNHESI